MICVFKPTVARSYTQIRKIELARLIYDLRLSMRTCVHFF